MLSKKVLWASMFILLILTSIGSVSATPENVSVYQFNDSATVSAGGSTSVQWVLYNNGTSDQLITVSMDTVLPTEVTCTIEPSHIVLEPEQTVEVYLTVFAESTMYDTDLVLVMNFTVTDMVSYQTMDVVDEVDLEIDSLYGYLDRENKIMGIWDNFLPAPFDGNWGAFVVSVILWIAVAYFMRTVFGPMLRSQTRKTEMKWDDIVIDVIRQPLFFLILLYGTLTSLETLELGDEMVANLELIYMICLVLIGALLSYRLLVKVFAAWARDRSARTDNEIDDVAVNLVETIGKVAIPVGAIFIIASMFGMDLGAAILSLGFLGIVVGYATKSTLSNLFAGMQLMIDRPFRIGERVLLDNGDQSFVVKIGFMTTYLRAIDDEEMVIIPNSLIASKVIVNSSQPDIRYKTNVKVRVPSNESPDRVIELMLEASRRTPNILQGDSAPVVRVSEVKEGRMLLTIFITVDDVTWRTKARSDLRSNIYSVFRENGVEIAMKRSQVWLNRV